MWSGKFLLSQRVLEFLNLIIIVVEVCTPTRAVLGIREKIQLQLRWMQFIHKSCNLCILRFNLFKCKNRWVLTHVQPCNHHHSQNKDVFITLKNPLVPFCSQFPPVSPASGNHWYNFYSYCFACSRMSYTWSHIVCNLIVYLSVNRTMAYLSKLRN